MLPLPRLKFSSNVEFVIVIIVLVLAVKIPSDLPKLLMILELQTSIKSGFSVLYS
jgi:hypothetical protein